MGDIFHGKVKESRKSCQGRPSTIYGPLARFAANMSSCALRGAISVAQKGSRTFFLLPSAAAVATRPPPNTGRRGISGRALREEYVKPKPFNYERWQFNNWWNIIDRTTPRFNENTKIVVVEGAHAVGKTAFAQELAEQLDMKYFPHVTMDEIYVNYYGDDLRNYSHLLTSYNQPWAEKEFARDPMSGHDGAVDRLHTKLYYLKFNQYLSALRHLFNTGQGCVIERSCYSDYANFYAAYNQGWMHRSTRDFYDGMVDNSLHNILRPNLIIYLDASVDVVMKKIAARGNEWDKNSPVWGNAAYLNDVNNTMKKEYLAKERSSSQVLVYDWTEPGEVESVVEDIESLNFEEYGRYEEQQKDWRFVLEEVAAQRRGKYSSAISLHQMRIDCLNPNYNEAEKLFFSKPDMENLREVEHMMRGGQYAPGFNTDCGDKWMDILMKFWGYDSHAFEGRLGTMPGAGMGGEGYKAPREEVERRRKENIESIENGNFGKWL